MPTKESVTLTNGTTRRVIIGPSKRENGKPRNSAVVLGTVDDRDSKLVGASPVSATLTGAQAAMVQGKALSGALEKAGVRVQ